MSEPQAQTDEDPAARAERIREQRRATLAKGRETRKRNLEKKKREQAAAPAPGNGAAPEPPLMHTNSAAVRERIHEREVGATVVDKFGDIPSVTGDVLAKVA